MRNILWYEDEAGGRGVSIDISDGVNPCWQIHSGNPKESMITVWFGAMSSIVDGLYKITQVVLGPFLFTYVRRK